MYKIEKDRLGNQYYSVLMLEEVKALIFELLVIIDKVAKKNNIPYWIDGGTLLGAKRHKGFIPWDDDIDVCFLKDDYDKFIPLLHDYIKNDEDYALAFYNFKQFKFWQEYLINKKFLIRSGGLINPAKIDITPVKLIENNSVMIEQDKLITDKANWFVRGKTKYFNHLKTENKFYNLKNALSKRNVFLTFFLDDYLSRNTELENKNDLLLNYVYNDSLVVKERPYYKYSDVFPLSSIVFEGKEFPCPSNIHNYLTILYGDYMQLPDLEYRKPAHFNFVDKSKRIQDKDLRLYLKDRNERFYKVNKKSYKILSMLKKIRHDGFKNTIDKTILPFLKRGGFKK